MFSLLLSLLLFAISTVRGQSCSSATSASLCGTGCTWCPDVNVIPPTTVPTIIPATSQSLTPVVDPALTPAPAGAPGPPNDGPTPGPLPTAQPTAQQTTGPPKPTSKPEQKPTPKPTKKTTPQPTPVPTPRTTPEPTPHPTAHPTPPPQPIQFPTILWTPTSLPTPVPREDDGMTKICSEFLSCELCLENDRICCWRPSDNVFGLPSGCMAAGGPSCGNYCPSRRQANAFVCVADAQCRSVVVEGANSATSSKGGNGGGGGRNGGQTMLLGVGVAALLVCLAFVAGVLFIVHRRRRNARLHARGATEQPSPHRSSSRMSVRRASQSRVRAAPTVPAVTPTMPIASNTYGSLYAPTHQTQSTYDTVGAVKAPTYDLPTSSLQPRVQYSTLAATTHATSYQTVSDRPV